MNKDVFPIENLGDFFLASHSFVFKGVWLGGLPPKQFSQIVSYMSSGQIIATSHGSLTPNGGK